jgi:outer membrane protein TolC
LAAGCGSVNRRDETFHREPIVLSKSALRPIGEDVFSACPRGSGELVGTVDLDLALLTDIAFENSPETRRSWQLAQLAAAQRNRAFSAFFPTLTATATATRQRIDNPVQSGVDPFYVTAFGEPSLRLTYTLFTFGAARAAAEATWQTLVAAQFQHNRSLQTLFFRVQTAYFTMDSALASLEARDANLLDAIETQKLEEVRMQAGLSSRQTLLRARASVLQAQGRLEEARAAVERARAGLAEVVGVRVSPSFNVVRSQLPEAVELLNGDIENMVAKALSSRQDLLAAFAQWKAATQWERAARDSHFPRIVVTAEGSNGDYLHFGRGKTFTASVGLSWDVFSGFDKFFRCAEQRAQRNVARENLRSAGLRAASEVWSQYFSYQSAYRQLLSCRALLEAAREAHAAAEIAYRSGLCSFMDLLSAQSALAAARESLVAAENAFSTSLAALAYAVGDLDAIDS